MANLKEVRKRIVSVNTTKQITSAMKMVAASRLRRAQMALLGFRPYAFKMREILLSLTAEMENLDENPLMHQREINRVLIVAIASNRGLCGAFNNNITKSVKKLTETKYENQLAEGKIDIITIGKTLTKFYKKRSFKIINSFDSIYESLNYHTSLPIAEQLMDFYIKGEYDRIELVYNRFKNPAVQILTVEQFLPVASDFSMQSEEIKHEEADESIKKRTSKASGATSAVGGGAMPKYSPAEMRAMTQSTEFGLDKVEGKSLKNYIYEPNQQEIVINLIPKTLKVQFYRALLESYASEHGARMTAMHQATDNALELIKHLTLEYNKARQAAITNEILEIVSGAEALKNN